MKRIQIDPEIEQFLLSHSVDLGEDSSTILRRELHLPDPPNTIQIDDDVYQFLVSKATSLQESPASILRRELGMQPGAAGPAPGGASVVVFAIAPQTGNQPWNTRETMLVAKVGDTLRIVNNDSVAHQLHTNGAPFPHPGSAIAAQSSAEFALATPYDSTVSGPLYDHAFGQTAQFWIRVQAAA